MICIASRMPEELRSSEMFTEKLSSELNYVPLQYAGRPE